MNESRSDLLSKHVMRGSPNTDGARKMPLTEIHQCPILLTCCQVPLARPSVEEVQGEPAGAGRYASPSALMGRKIPALDDMLRCSRNPPPQPELKQLLNRLSDH